MKSGLKSIAKPVTESEDMSIMPMAAAFFCHEK